VRLPWLLPLPENTVREAVVLESAEEGQTLAMTTPVRFNPRLREDYHWTERQREVLWMLVKGHSNGRIAEELGISLDGAKWHIREIMSKLGVDSRDEAAEYWRAYNGLSLRFSRLFRAVFGAFSLKWIAGGTAGAAVASLAVAVVAVVVLRATAERADEADGADAVGQPGTVSPLPGGSTPGPVPGGLRTLTLAPAVQGVREAVLYTATGCFQCDGADQSLQRHVTDASGVMTTTTLLESKKGPLSGWVLGAVGGSPDAALLVAVACGQEDCGGLGPGNPATRWRVMGSADGGTTWRDAFSATARYVQVSSVSAAGFVVLTVSGPEGQPARSFAAVTPTGERPLSGPASLPGQAEPVLLGDGRVLWVDTGGTAVFDDRGSPLALFIPEGATQVIARGVRSLPGGGIAVSFVDGSAPNRSGEIVQVYDAALAPVSGFGSTLAFQAVAVSARLALGGVVGADIGLADQATVYPALIDLAGGTVAPVTARVFTEQRGRNRLVAVKAGVFAVVSAGGDCLNVRLEPSTAAETLGCFADGTLLADRGETREADGKTWLAVIEPGGRAGWASLEFLER